MQTNRIWAGVIALIIFALIALALLQHSGSSVPMPGTATTSSATSTQTHDGVTGTGGFTVSGSNTVNLNIPNFRAPIDFSTTIQSDVKNAIQQAANTLEGRLAINSLDLKSWVDLGTVRKMAGDYKGAETAWLFVTQAAPTNSLAYNNLGDLYQNFIKNYPKAEQEYLTAIKISPTEEGAYLNLYTIYANLDKKSATAAEDILKKGVAAIPSSVDLHVQLARYYKAKGDTADAKTQYDAAIVAANKAGQAAVASQLQTEENQ